MFESSVGKFENIDNTNKSSDIIDDRQIEVVTICSRQERSQSKGLEGIESIEHTVHLP